MTLSFSGLTIGSGLIGLSSKYIGIKFNINLLSIIWALCALIFF